MRISQRPLNMQALALEEAQSKIRLAVKEAYFSRKSFERLKRDVRTIIKGALAEINIPDLKAAAERSLSDFFAKLVRTVRAVTPTDILVFAALSKLTQDEDSAFSFSKMTVAKAKSIVEDNIPAMPQPYANNYADAINLYHKEYLEEKVLPVIERMAKEEALDPNSQEYVQQRQTLRARAEREVRHKWHTDRREELIASGVRLVIISAHANCSERCRPFQNRVFSLDGTRGRTDDGRTYEPIEKATEIFVTTSAGRVWKNGLFGFNCRHYMIPYKSKFQFPIASAEEEEKQYKIDVRQRELERRVISYKVRAEMEKGVNPKLYRRSREKARYWDRYYRAFSKANDRAYFPSRTKTL